MSEKMYPPICMSCNRRMRGFRCACGANYSHVKEAVKKKKSVILPKVKEALPNHLSYKDRDVK